MHRHVLIVALAIAQNREARKLHPKRRLQQARRVRVHFELAARPAPRAVDETGIEAAVWEGRVTIDALDEGYT
eukprot:scaffold6572_cov87-Isochrysis_galbana.AAC.2